MLKYAILLINFIGLLIFRLFFPGGVSLTTDFPENLEPGDEVIVTVNISKGDLSGFAKFTQKLPEGFTASLVSGADATFSFKDQDVKFIWVALPAEADFSISYRVTIDPQVNGNFDIGGTFAYIFDNDKQNAELGPISVTIGTGASGNKPEEKAIAGKVADEITKVQCRRTTSPIAGLQNTFKVELRIDKPGISGFAKIEESIPEGFYASEMESNGGIFSFTDQMMKVIWMAIPDDDRFIISYKLTSSDNVSGNQRISGEFSYLQEDEPKKYFIEPSTIFIEKDEGDEAPMIIIADEGGNFKEKEKPEEELVEEEPVEEVVAAEPKPTPPAPKPTPVPAPQTDVTYSVQVAAGHVPVPGNYFAKKFQLREDINTLNHEGWIKYTFGQFNVYKDCRDRRNRVWSENKITDAFVTAYNAGRRITVQEALMITNQQWYN